MSEIAAYWIDLPDELVGAALEEGLVVECLDHGVLEGAEGLAPERVEAWIEVTATAE